MNNRVLKVLEFDKILSMLASFAVLDINKENALNLVPANDMEDANLLICETVEAESLILKRGTPPISQLGDVIACVKRLNISAILREKELLNIAKLLKCARLLKDYASEDSELNPYFNMLIPLKSLEDEITSKILSEDEIADNASIKLYSIRKKIKATHEKIREMLNKYIVSPTYQKYLQEAIVTLRGDRFVIPVKIEHKGDVPGIVHDTSSSGSTVFIEPMSVVEANNSLMTLFSDESEEIERILYELTALASGNSTELLNDYEVIRDLDFIFAKGQLAIKQKATKPILNKRGYINLKKARHPLIDPSVVVPIDIYLGDDYSSLIVTGPNTGGKTVTIKTVGLISLMAASGLLIPAFDKSDVAFFDNIYADIGDEQSITQSLSTFSSHMTNIVSILKDDLCNSLVLFDELGAGTDPVEGASLAISIIEHLRKKNARIIATTHYSELKLYALSTKGVKNASCEFDVETLSPTYKLLIGVPGKSNAFAISKKLGLSDEVLESAKEQLHEDNIKFEDVLSEIERNRIQLEKERNLANKYKEEAESLKQELANQKNVLEQKHADIMEKAHLKAKEILEDAKEEADTIIKDLRKLRETQSQKEFDRETSKAREKLSSKIKNEKSNLRDTKINKTTKINPNTLLPGTTVTLLMNGQDAIVQNKPDNKGNLTVVAGIMNIKVNITEIALSDKKEEKEQSYVTMRRTQLQNKKVSTELDLRGQTVLDGVMDAEKFIDDALMLHLEKVSIIHGKGTGALRSGIHTMLKNNKQVKSFRLGTFGEGETGVTIVELK